MAQMIPKKKLEPLTVTRTEASYQSMMLQLMSKLNASIHDNNELLKCLMHRETGGISPLKNVFDSREQSPTRIHNSTQQQQTPTQSKIISVLQRLTQNVRFTQATQDKLISVMGEVKEAMTQNRHHQIERNHEEVKKQSLNDGLSLFSGKKAKGIQGFEELKVMGGTVEKYMAKQVERDVVKKKNSLFVEELLPHIDRREMKVNFRVSDLLEVEQIKNRLRQTTAQWLGSVYRSIASICWNNLVNGTLTFDQVKVLFTQNVVFNYIGFINQLRSYGLDDTSKGLTQLINDKSCEILDFLCTQYPQTKIQAPNVTLRASLPPIQNDGKLQYDLVSRSGVGFLLNQNKDYTSQIMRVLNYMIQSTNDEYDEFKSYMENIFQQVYLPSDKRGKGLGEKELTVQDFAYKESVKKYTSYQIGRKIPKNTQMYTEEEILDGIFFVKSTPVLRIVTKWVQELYDYFRHAQKNIKNSYDEKKDHIGRPLYLSAQLRNILFEEIRNRSSQLQHSIEEIKRECYVMEQLLTNPSFTTDTTQTHLSPEQISVGKYCSNLKTSISAYLCSQLNEIIHMLLEFPKRVDEVKLPKEKGQNEEGDCSKAKRLLNKINFVTCRIFDLLRCKCHSNEEEILWIVQELLKRSKSSSKELNILRIKDRLNMGTRDILINVQLNRGTVCEIQLSVAGNSDRKQQQLNMYNHFLYELKRSFLGPITQNVSIWATLQQRFSYFEKLRSDHRREAIQWRHACEGEMVTFTRPIICQACTTFYAIPQTCLLNLRCNLCATTLCGECYYQMLNSDERKKFIFGKTLLSRDILDGLTEYTSEKQPFQINGFFIKKNFLKRELSFYMATLKSGGKPEESSNEQILVVHTVLRHEGLVNRQINRKPLYVTVNQSKFYLKNHKKSELNQLIIFFLPQQDKKLINFNDLQAYLEKPQNARMRVVSIVREPSYIQNLKKIHTAIDKNRELRTLREALGQSKITTFFFRNTILLAQACVRGALLREDITRKNNIKCLKDFARRESDVVSMQAMNFTNEFDILPVKLQPNYLKSLCNSTYKLFLSHNGIVSLQSFWILQNLQFLVVSNNAITSLKGVEKLTHLVQIRFSN